MKAEHHGTSLLKPAPVVLSGEASRLAEVSQQTIRTWAREGRLKAFTTAGGVLLFDRQEVERVALTRRRKQRAL